MTNKEIEKKYLVAPPLELLEKCNSQFILQGYLVICEDSSEVRIRKINERFFLTLKRGKGLVRQEYEIELSMMQFNSLWPGVEPFLIQKRRYFYPYGEFIIEIDVYSGKMDGLTIAEIEFTSILMCNKFIPPKWFIREITSDERYKNQSLVRFGIPKE